MFNIKSSKATVARVFVVLMRRNISK